MCMKWSEVWRRKYEEHFRRIECHLFCIGLMWLFQRMCLWLWLCFQEVKIRDGTRTSLDPQNNHLGNLSIEIEHRASLCFSSMNFISDLGPGSEVLKQPPSSHPIQWSQVTLSMSHVTSLSLPSKSSPFPRRVTLRQWFALVSKFYDTAGVRALSNPRRYKHCRRCFKQNLEIRECTEQNIEFTSIDKCEESGQWSSFGLRAGSWSGRRECYIKQRMTRESSRNKSSRRLISYCFFKSHSISNSLCK